MTANAPWAILPVKGFSRGKSRLGTVLAQAERAAFAEGLFTHVVSVLRGVRSLSGVVVVTDDPDVRTRALAFDCSVAPDPEERTLAAVVDRGFASAAALGASAALVLMADLPRLATSDVEAVLVALLEHPVVVAPDLQEAGTNLLALAPPTLFGSCFGRVDSFQCHLARAREHGFTPLVLRREGLCFDVDGPEDLARARHAGRPDVL